MGPLRRLGALCLAAAVLAPAARAATNPIQAENARPATPGWAPVAETTSIEGYADRTSVAPGETIAFHVAAAAPGARYRLLVFRLGWYSGGGARLAACLPACDGHRAALHPRPPPAYDPATGRLRAEWPATDELAIPADWVSGYYEARVALTAGPDAGRAYRIWFVVRELALRPSAALVQVPVNTWQA